LRDSSKLKPSLFLPSTDKLKFNPDSGVISLDKTDKVKQSIFTDYFSKEHPFSITLQVLTLEP